MKDCLVEGCGRRHSAHGYCPVHYQRWRRDGDAGGPAPRTDGLAWNAPPLARFEHKIDRHGPIAKNHPELGRCWVWRGRKSRGYGVFSINRHQATTHRWAYEHWIGPVPDGLDLDHFACDNRACANPHHVRPVTRRENTARGTAERPGNAAKVRCIADHPFDEENTYIDPAGKRYCRKCRRRREAEYERRRRERTAA